MIASELVYSEPFGEHSYGRDPILGLFKLQIEPKHLLCKGIL